ncbi:FHA domain-containing protein [Blastococcus brunescens]|uniref:FHA domain-containing protein n=1 Tax=Blastococcus brunescens TaxID=1564165 RepID=A0ABZ1AW85_9ACTN|nr:FHA domain-containing protein [Blastococcus sp. BMG 8361]WRL62833.1 FHA domain-containing protein [Blastococcus sp. BMG 8361]
MGRLHAPVRRHPAHRGGARPRRDPRYRAAGPTSPPRPRPQCARAARRRGPDAGRSFPLGQGSHVIGRSGDVHVRLDDPDISRRHASVHVGGGTVTVTDLGSSNGSRLDGADLAREPRNWPAGTVLRLGASALVLAGPEAPAAILDAGPDGRRRVRPLPA